MVKRFVPRNSYYPYDGEKKMSQREYKKLSDAQLFWSYASDLCKVLVYSYLIGISVSGSTSLFLMCIAVVLLFTTNEIDKYTSNYVGSREE